MGEKSSFFFFSFFICLSHFLLGDIWDFPPIRHVQGKFSSNNLYALNTIFLELSRFLVLCGKLCFRMQGPWKGSSLWDRIYDSSRDRVHFPLHFLLHVLKSNKDCSKTFFLSFIQMSADSIKESNFCILPSSIVNPVGLEDRQTWRIQLPFISYVTLDKELTPQCQSVSSIEREKWRCLSPGALGKMTCRQVLDAELAHSKQSIRVSYHYYCYYDYNYGI